MQNQCNYGGLDRFRIVAALLVIAIHTSPFLSWNEGFDFFFTRVLGRVAVPFFLMVTGQFVVSGFQYGNAREKLLRYIKKTAVLYVAAIMLYIPIGIYAGQYQALTLTAVMKLLLFDGTFYHLWYFPACITGVVILYLMNRRMRIQSMLIVAVILYIIGLGGDSYYGLVSKVPALKIAYDGIFSVFSYTRNGIFMAPIFLLMGAGLAKKPRSSGLPGFIISFLFMTAEAFTLHHFGWQRHDSMYVMLLPTMFFLYQTLLAGMQRPIKACRTVSTWMYILHPAMIPVVRLIARIAHMTPILVEQSLIHYLVVSLLSAAASLVIVRCRPRTKGRSSPGV